VLGESPTCLGLVILLYSEYPSACWLLFWFVFGISFLLLHFFPMLVLFKKKKKISCLYFWLNFFVVIIFFL
jgi:hypothetical protein